MRYLSALGLLVLSLLALGCSTATPTASPAPTAAAPTTAPATAPAPTSAAQKSGTMRFAHILSNDMRAVAILMAMDDLRAQGYTVQENSMPSSTVIIDALTRGDMDVANLNDQVVWSAVAKGAPIHTFMSAAQSPAYILAAQTIQTCADLNGKSIAVPTTTGLNITLLNLYLQKSCSGAKPQLVIVPEATARSAALVGGKVDATYVSQYEDVLNLEQTAPGKFKRLVNLYDVVPNLQVNGLHVRADWAKQNPQLLQDFVSALVTAYRRINATPGVLADNGVKYLKIDPAIAKQVGDALIQTNQFDPNGGFTQTTVQANLDLLTSTKAVPATVTVDQVADFSILNAVLDEIGRK